MATDELLTKHSMRQRDDNLILWGLQVTVTDNELAAKETGRGEGVEGGTFCVVCESQ